ncbi:conserved Plasmodium protein, unknown function [Plasmodium reichenowi]|uniref:Nuclear segregation protein n=11 Tax=Plasmodium (Laverania) TaxID=418107 RepID=C6KT13_PLAF7|nr:hypothetical protein PRSY57_0615900 [Plasmodium reichenowi]XP_966158.1 conserved protein, unknown function [Plasmodium falciparum 3D7]ETW19673.1 hypothetical protein PFFVO_01423 [Plasmodium falciparum Vietnam Oak-Knoll (FVO)]ETW37839.1 hypothetical protein PFTANZ_01489 [Plasmodium falciparum Tanzania (2000708)]ETW44288.1 hypothetical protein PFNF135_01537 [Plasmodium falciparum NF135/5.C10]ETW53172.1 hypothetical protein PFUGPA_04800 [Plasmodium falciparum Palo Alto/Uganda]ETW62713.1 hypot|eukprot:XP_966158.1 conserved Plasmodium protein, unknown function [Plasmodium falciparum 3D7]
MTEAENIKIEKPDFDAYNEKLGSISQSIDEIKKKIDNLQKEIKVANKGKEEYNKKKKDIVTKIDCFQSDIDKLENERRSILDDIEKKQKHKKELKVNAQNMKKQIGFENEEDIEKKIREIENKLMTSTISIKEEKLLINQIQALNKNKPLLSSYSKIENEASKYDDETIVPLKSKMDSIREKINKLRNEKKMERNKLKELQNSYQEKNNKLNELNNLRDNYSKKMNHYFMERRSITVEMEEKKQQYRSFKLNQLQAKQQKIKEDRERKNLELEKQSLEKKLEDIDVLPYREELALIENMLAYLKKLQEEFKLEESKKQQNAAKKINGEVETNENKDDNKTKNENNNKKAKSKKDKQKTFKLDMNILCYFVTAGINPPVSFDEIDSCIQKLHEKKDMYEQKRDESVKNVETRREDLTNKIKEIDEKLTTFKSGEHHNKGTKANKVKA